MKNLAPKTILAKLLANESINVIQDNVETASFDVLNRTLRLPYWEDMNNDVVDMFVGHEVAHALYTPVDGLMEYKKRIPGVPHYYVNVVEDIRIEKIILRKYPGLLNNFKRGYLNLIERDLFCVKGKDLKTIPFMDRLNLSMKARDLLAVPFTPEERTYVEMARAVETWEDVLRVCKELYDFAKDQASEQKADPDAYARKILVLMDAEEGEEDTSEEVDVNDFDEIIDLRENAKLDEKDNSDEAEENAGGKRSNQSHVENIDPEVVKTQESYDTNQAKLSDVSNGKIYAQPISSELARDAYTPYADVLEGRDLKPKAHHWMIGDGYKLVSYKDFSAELKVQVSAMVKEFEMRKAAYRSARARTSTKGSLDVNKLHSYKYNDQLFKQMTSLADGKNHGMMMLIDYSGSMISDLPQVIRQLMTLVSFCKRVNIPFQVFGFTTGARRTNRITRHVDESRANIYLDDLNMFELFSSKMTKREYDKAMETIFAQTQSTRYGNGYFNEDAASPYESLGGTPLISSLIVVDKLVEDFRRNHKIQKMNLVVLNDGESQRPSIRNLHSSRYRANTYIQVAGEMINLSKYHSATDKIINAFNKNGIRTINYFVGKNGYELKSTMMHMSAKEKSAMRKDIRNHGMATIDNNRGYDRRFIIKSLEVNADNDLEIDDDADAAKIAKAFSKHVGNKTKARKIAQKFAEIVS